MRKVDVAVIGAGWAGLTAASHLATRGHQVAVLEKSRGAGGRSATRREGGVSFDHGAQYFTARSDAFAHQAERWRRSGLVAEWQPVIEVIGKRPSGAGSAPVSRWVGVPGMNAVLHRFSRGLDCRFRWPVRRMERERNWIIESGEGETIAATAVVVTAPPAQTAEMLGTGHRWHDRLKAIEMNSCWALMLGYESSAGVPFDAAFVNEGPLAWVARDASKPGRDARMETWVVHASSRFSREHLENDEDGVTAKMLDALCEIDEGFDSVATVCRVHRWRYAMAAEPLDQGVMVDDRQRLVVAGDWCAGNRIEGAWTSGVAAARRIEALL